MAGTTDEGRRKFGEFVRESRIAAGFATQAKFAEYLTNRSLGSDGKPMLPVKESAINTLEAARYRQLMAIDPIIAVIESGVLKHKDGRVYTFDDAIAVLTGRLCPINDEVRSEV